VLAADARHMIWVQVDRSTGEQRNGGAEPGRSVQVDGAGLEGRVVGLVAADVDRGAGLVRGGDGERGTVAGQRGSVPGAVEILGGGLIAPEVILGAVKDKTRHEEECHQGHQEN